MITNMATANIVTWIGSGQLWYARHIDNKDIRGVGYYKEAAVIDLLNQITKLK